MTEEQKQEHEHDTGKPLTREQRRHIDRINKEAHEKLGKLVNHFYEFFMDNDPASDQVKEKQKEVSAKWKMYCHHRQLSGKALPMCDERCSELIAQYMAIKAEAK